MSESVFRDDVKVVILRRFAYEHIANIYAARLRDEGISCFLSNSNVGTLMPLSEGSFVLHVAESDVEDAQELLKSMDEQAQTPVEQDYHDASLEEIEYAKKINRHEQRMQRKEGRVLTYSVLAVVLIIAIWIAVQNACSSSIGQ